MHFTPTLRFFHKNNAQHIRYMLALIFLKNLDLRQVSVDSEMPILGQPPRCIDGQTPPPTPWSHRHERECKGQTHCFLPTRRAPP